jgi:hypothetical protein
MFNLVAEGDDVNGPFYVIPNQKDERLFADQIVRKINYLG